MPELTLAGRLEDHLDAARAAGEDLPRTAHDYLDEWAHPSKGWLRKFYAPGSDEVLFDLSPAAEKAVHWVARLLERRFVGTESRLLTVFQLLTEILERSDADPDTRLAELYKRREQLDAEIERVKAGDVELLDPPAVRERFHQMASTARELLGDFRELEASFHQLDREVRKKIASWEGGRGELLDGILGDRDALAASDQGKSFRAFWDFLMSPERQEELTDKLERVLALDALEDVPFDPRLRRIHFDWLAAGDLTQRTVARLSQQLRQYLDDRVWHENRRIMTLVRQLEQHALALAESPPAGVVAELDSLAPELGLPMERPPFEPPIPAVLHNLKVELAPEDGSADALFDQVAIDRRALQDHVRRLLMHKPRVSLKEVLDSRPLEHGLAELVTWYAIAADDPKAVIHEDSTEAVVWSSDGQVPRVATVPLLVFFR